MKKDEHYQWIMLVAAGPAMAAGCEPYLNMVIPNLIETKVPEADIRMAIETAEMVKSKPLSLMNDAVSPFLK